MGALSCEVVSQLCSCMVTVRRQTTIIQFLEFINAYTVNTVHDIHLLPSHTEKLEFNFSGNLD